MAGVGTYKNTNIVFLFVQREKARKQKPKSHTYVLFSQPAPKRNDETIIIIVCAPIARFQSRPACQYNRGVCIINYTYRCEPAIFRATMRLITPNFCFPCERSIHLSLSGLYAAAHCGREMKELVPAARHTKLDEAAFQHRSSFDLIIDNKINK